MRARWLPLLALGLFGACAPKTQVVTEEAVDFGAIRRVGVLPLSGAGAKGAEVALAMEKALQAASYDPVDHKAIVDVMDRFKPDKDFGYDLEALETLRKKTDVDAVVFGRIQPDWSAVSITMIDAEMGDPILRAILRPRRGKVFKTPDQIGAEFAKMLVKRR